MTADRCRTAIFAIYARCRGAFLAALAAAALLPGAAQAEPAFESRFHPTRAAPGVWYGYLVQDWFTDFGAGAEFTDAYFSTTAYYDVHEIRNGRLMLQAKTAEALNALDEPPLSPFTVTVDVTMTNDAGETASGTITFKTTYERTGPLPDVPDPTFIAQPNPVPLVPDGAWNFGVEELFDEAGTNPTITSVVWSSTAYYHTRRFWDGGGFHVRAKTAAELNALNEPPPSPFTVTADVTMANDEGRTASGTITFQTTYERVEPEPQPPPVFALTERVNVAPGEEIILSVDDIFDNTGTNPRFVGDPIQYEPYYFVNYVYRGGRQHLRAKARTSAQLNALPTPPASNPLRLHVKMKMTNDEGRTASGTITFETTYDRVEPEPEPEVVPTFSHTGTINARPGDQANVSVLDAFDNAGTNPRFTDAVFSTTEYYDWISTSDSNWTSSIVRSGRIYVNVKTEAALNALASPPPSPFTVDVTVTMTNDEGQTASGTVTFRTTYERVEPEPEPEPEEVPPPTAKSGTIALNNPIGLKVSDLFDNPGTNPRFTGDRDVTYSTRAYYRFPYSGIVNNYLSLAVKSVEDLNAMTPPPPNPFTVDVTVKMVNDEGHSATGTFTFETTWKDEPEPEPEPEPEGPPPTAKSGTIALNNPNWFRVSDLFDNPGTNPRFTGDRDVTYSTRAYYRFPYSGIVNNALSLAAKSAADLNALAPPPPNPFTVDVTVKIVNDEGHSATGTFTFETTYDRVPPPTSTPAPPTSNPLQPTPEGADETS